MSYTINDLINCLRELQQRGLEFVVIGDTAVQLALGKESLEGDIDLFVMSPGIVGHEDMYMDLAVERGWGYGYTEIGTPKLIARVDGKEVVIELYENMLDFNIPEQILRESTAINLGEVSIKVLKPEQYLVLKARQGVDLDKIKKILKEIGRVDTRLIKKTLSYMDEEERSIVESRLIEAGLKL